MTTAVDICNLGLAKLGSSRVTSLNPPRSPQERHCATGYPHWRDSELSGPRRWTSSLKLVTLTQTGPAVVYQGQTLYPYPLPPNVLRPIRDRSTAWTKRGNALFDAKPALQIEAVCRITEDEMDPFLVEVLACRVAAESVEFATQSSTKGDAADARYQRALREASRANAFVIGDEDVTASDETDEWLLARGG